MKARPYIFGIFNIIITFCHVDESSQNCTFSTDWKRQLNQATCRGNSPYLAFIEEKDSRYKAKCCTDQESQEFEKEEIEQCETTECLVGRNQSNLCSTLPQYITESGEQVKYEVSLKDDCKHEKSRRNGTTAVCCPKGSLPALLVSTSAAEQNEFPFMGSTGGCGATVYNNQFVISAAHCFINSTTGNMIKGPHKVVLGTNIDELQSKSNTYPVSEVTVHENCSFLKGHRERERHYRRHYNDIALVKLKRKIDFRKDPSIRALQIAPQNFRPEEYSKRVLILGWGTTQLGRTSEHLQKANILWREDSLCFDKRYGNLGEKQYEVMEFAKQFLCLGGIVKGSFSNSAGRGDSGGPAICRDENGEALLCGVASFGSEHDEEKCAKNQNEMFCQPSVYEDIGYFHDWIVKHAGKQDSQFLHKARLYGVVVPRGRYLHQVHVTTTDGLSCGGTLISSEVVVTAAHCVLRDNGEKRRGIKIVTGVDQRQSYRPAVNGIVHSPRFSRYSGLDRLNDTKSGRATFTDPPYADDIAVIKLGRAVSGMRKRDFAKLPSSIHFKPGRATEIALPVNEGRKSYGGTLMQREFKILTRSECRKRLNRLHAIGIHVRMDQSKIMCAVEVFSGGSTCDRELGGGLMCFDERIGEEVFCGVQMFRMCEMTLPSAFLNVGRYLDLIQSVIGR